MSEIDSGLVVNALERIATELEKSNELKEKELGYLEGIETQLTRLDK